MQPTAAFHDRKNRRNFRSCLWAADVAGAVMPCMSGSVLNHAITRLEHHLGSIV